MNRRPPPQLADNEAFETFDATGMQVVQAISGAMAQAVRQRSNVAWEVRFTEGWVLPPAFACLFADPTIRVFDRSTDGGGPYALLYEPTAGFIRVTPSDEPQDPHGLLVLHFHRSLEIGDYDDEVSVVVWVEIHNLAAAGGRG